MDWIEESRWSLFFGGESVEMDFIGEPIVEEEFVEHYMYLFESSIRQLCAIDEFLPKEKEYLQAEYRCAWLLYQKFEADQKRPPDYRYLSDSVTNAVIAREYLFQEREKNIMNAEHFSERYINLLYSEGLLTPVIFGATDFAFIKQSEQHRATKRYEEEDHFTEGYEMMRIQNNRFLQNYVIQQLADSFLDLYSVYMKKRQEG